MLLGGPIFAEYKDPEGWALCAKALGYTAVYFPVDFRAEDDLIREYAQAARRHSLVIAEVGAWSNPLSPNPETKKRAMETCIRQLMLADQVGARCCVNIAGSFAEQWDGPHEKNLTEDGFALIVDTVREIIDQAAPRKSYYTLELMPWMYPTHPQNYLRLIKAIDRSHFAVHLDPVNIICSPEAYWNNAQVIRECFDILAPYIKSCHAKDTILRGNLTVHIDECVPGTGNLSYATFLKELSVLPGHVPMMLEHLDNAEQLDDALKHIRGIADGLGLSFGD